MYQAAGALNLKIFIMAIWVLRILPGTKIEKMELLTSYQNLQTSIITDILTLEIITHTPILTNSTTEITLDDAVQKTEKQIAKENKKVEKRIKKAADEEEKKICLFEKAERKAEKAAAKAEKKAKKQKK